MRILVTGAGGMLGSDILATLSGKHELFGVDLKSPANKSPEVAFQVLDITNTKDTYEQITKINPELVIHTAAFTDVDGAESKPELAFQANAIGTRNVALSCQRFDAQMIYISSDYVFDGTKTTPYVEYDQPNPLGIYARSKYWGELYTQWLLNKFIIIRSSWLFGRNGRNFAQAFLSQVKNQHNLRVVSDQVGAPTYTLDLAAAINDLISVQEQVGTGLYGIWHITNSGKCSWYDFAQEILKQIKNTASIEAISTAQLERPAPRPRNSVLDNSNWRLQNFASLPPWQDALRRYLRESGEI
jgi:dTDP-4-dehydrorhamnose reductase